MSDDSGLPDCPYRISVDLIPGTKCRNSKGLNRQCRALRREGQCPVKHLPDPKPRVFFVLRCSPHICPYCKGNGNGGYDCHHPGIKDAFNRVRPIGDWEPDDFFPSFCPLTEV